MYVVIGANGYLGSYIIRRILQDTEEHVIATCRNMSKRFCTDDRVQWLEFDLEDQSAWKNLQAIMEASGEGCNVVMLAAYHHPDFVHKNPELAHKINVELLDALLGSLPCVRCLCYPSTDSVYGESISQYHFKETDALCPVNVYGRQKAQAEQVVLAHGYCVVRLPFLIGPSLLPHKRHFYDEIAESIRAQRPIELFCDSLRSSLDFDTAAALIVKLMEQGSRQNIFNLSGDDDLSKYDVGLLIANKLGADNSCVKPILMSNNTTIFKTARAQSTLMDNSLAKRVLGINSIQIHI